MLGGLRFFYVYKVTNIINGKIYIGKRSCDCNPVDDIKYIGSGKFLKLAIGKYGIHNFIKEIIELCDIDSINSREIYWIHKLNSTNKNIGYNVAGGGEGGDIISRLPNKREIWDKQQIARKAIWDNNLLKFGKKTIVPSKLIGRKYSIEELSKRVYGPRPKQSLAMKGKRKSEKHRETMSLKWKDNFPLMKCPHCGKEGRVRMKATHFDNCKVIRPDYFAYKHSDETKIKLAEAAQNRKRLPCNYCGNSYTPAIINRWHNENCKHKMLQVQQSLCSKQEIQFMSAS